MQLIVKVREFSEIDDVNDIMIMILVLTVTCYILLATGNAVSTAAPTMKPSAAPSKPPTRLTNLQQAAAATAEGLELFALAKAIPKLQAGDGASFKLRRHLHHTSPVINLIRWTFYYSEFSLLRYGVVDHKCSIRLH